MSTSETNISIRSIETREEYRAIEELQRSVWQMPDWRDVVPTDLLVAVHKNGGIILGAFDESRQLVGFVFSFVGVEDDQGQRRIKHCSHMLAVLPTYQAQGIGARLKWAQRACVLAQGIDLITWTYDPLLARNAHLNLACLGAIALRYIPNAYGEMTDGLNAGLASDRFEVEWWLNAPRVLARIENKPRADWDALVGAGAQPSFDIAFDARDLPRLGRVNEPHGNVLLVEIPADLNVLKSAAPSLAREWRAHTRDLFQRAFAAGYVADDFVVTTRDARKRTSYLLKPSTNSSGNTVPPSSPGFQVPLLQGN